MQIPKAETREHGGTLTTDLLRVRIAEGHDTHGQAYQEVHTGQTYVLRAAAPATEVQPG